MVTGALVNIAELRSRAQLTLSQGDGEDWLPYEETWFEMTTAVLALVEVVEAAQAVASHFGLERRDIYTPGHYARDHLREAIDPSLAKRERWARRAREGA